MDRKRLFDEDPAKYELRRPNYPAQVFDDILAYSGAGTGRHAPGPYSGAGTGRHAPGPFSGAGTGSHAPGPFSGAGTGSHALEVGPGTGQATGPLLRAGLNVTAVELGTSLAAYTMRKFADYPGLSMVNLPFEQFRCAPNAFDLFYSATAFHWVPAELGYPKAYELLKPGGAIALFWNRPAANDPGDGLHRRIQEVYDEVAPQMSRKGQPEDGQAVYDEIDRQIATAGFASVERRLYHATREFTGADYVELLDTYSDHRALEEGARARLYVGIREAIEGRGGKLVIHDTVDLHLGKKP